MAKETAKRMGVSNSPVSGTNPNHWPNPDERDTTRGTPLLNMPSLHSNQPRACFTTETCSICGDKFACAPGGDRKNCGNIERHKVIAELANAKEINFRINRIFPSIQWLFPCVRCGAGVGVACRIEKRDYLVHRERSNKILTIAQTVLKGHCGSCKDFRFNHDEASTCNLRNEDKNLIVAAIAVALEKRNKKKERKQRSQVA